MSTSNTLAILWTGRSASRCDLTLPASSIVGIGHVDLEYLQELVQLYKREPCLTGHEMHLRLAQAPKLIEMVTMVTTLPSNLEVA